MEVRRQYTNAVYLIASKAALTKQHRTHSDALLTDQASCPYYYLDVAEFPRLFASHLYSDSDMVGRVVYEVRVSTPEAYRELCERIARKENVHFSPETTKMAVITKEVREFADLSFTRYVTLNYHTRLDNDIKAAKQGHLASANKVLQHHVTEVGPKDLLTIIYANRRDEDFLQRVPTLLGGQCSLFEMAVKDEESASMILSSRLAKKLQPLQLAKLSECYPSLVRALFKQQALEKSAHSDTLLKNQEAAQYCFNSIVLCDLYGVEAVDIQKQKENLPRFYQTALHSGVYGLAYLQACLSDKELRAQKSLSMAHVIIANCNKPGFSPALRDLNNSMPRLFSVPGQKLLLQLAMESPLAARELLRNADTLCFFSPSDRLTLLIQHGENDSFQADLACNQFLPAATVVNILKMAHQAGPAEAKVIFNLFAGSEALKKYYEAGRDFYGECDALLAMYNNTAENTQYNEQTEVYTPSRYYK